MSTVANWNSLNAALPVSNGWHHSGVAVEADGTVYCADPRGGALLVIPPSGPTRRVPVGYAELHGITLVRPGVIAVADPGWRMQESAPHVYSECTTPGGAGLLRTDSGAVLTSFAQPKTVTYAREGWRPTSIVVLPDSQDVWVADGYGLNRLHRFASSGEHLAELHELQDGTVLDCPHALLALDPDHQLAGPEARLLVADRGNHRLLALSRDGELVRSFGAEHLDSPSGLAIIDGHLFVTELHGGIAHFSPTGDFLGSLEPTRSRDHDESGWPNVPGPEPGTLVSPDPAPSVLNSPHGLAAHGGSLYLTEWFIGGRLSRIDNALTLPAR